MIVSRNLRNRATPARPPPNQVAGLRWLQTSHPQRIRRRPAQGRRRQRGRRSPHRHQHRPVYTWRRPASSSPESRWEGTPSVDCSQPTPGSSPPPTDSIQPRTYERASSLPRHARVGYSQPSMRKSAGSGPVRRPLSRVAIAAMSSASSSNPKTSMFSAMRDGVTDLGSTISPSCRCHRIIT